ncbi:hypothetical protein AB0K51_26255 [Kitasatospora sp. NPDC049285]|uniref:hypothetical protein n=1 Tax=Kitasatospora sp. NPDC049285 TaxID=3157096 RepID=UPI003431A3D2
MAKKLKALSDLKAYFGNYEDFEHRLKNLNTSIVHLNKLNKTSAGNDDIGKQYHQQVDKPTEDLTKTVGYIGTSLGRVGTAGKTTADQLQTADDDASKKSNNW